MRVRSSPAARSLWRAQEAARYARRTGCDIGEATSVLAESAAGAAAGAGTGSGGRSGPPDPGAGGAGEGLSRRQVQGRRSGNLHFAGEHTSVDFQGYMEGALRSGYRCAAEIARR